MAEQPNPFERGIELPAGCKDLHELLEKFGGQEHMEQPARPIGQGSLTDLPEYVQRVFMEPYGSSLIVTILEAKAILWVHNRYGGPHITFLLREQHKALAEAVPDLFRDAAFHLEEKGGAKTIFGRLPDLWLEAAEVVQKVISGYGVSENTSLLFHLAGSD